MQLFYALGGGFGHFSRTLAVIHSLQIPQKEALILTSIQNPPKTGIKTHSIHPQVGYNKISLEKALYEILLSYDISAVYIDAFPYGLRGEWAEFRT